MQTPADRLLAELGAYGRVLVAFSGGVDSGLVLAAAVRALGADGVGAVTAVSSALPATERAAAAQFCARLGVTHHAVPTDELDRAGYRDNGPQRCYFCKSTLLDAAVALAAQHGYPAVATGTNADDVRTRYRPGIRAAAERGARTPLADAGLDKAAVRAVAREWGLDIWDKPAAACLSSRIAYGIAITPARLSRVERAEVAVREVLGHRLTDLRVRDLGDAVRVEVDRAALGIASAEPRVVAAVHDAGFGDRPVTVELFRSGSMNDSLHH